jgi:hypothetical protein
VKVEVELAEPAGASTARATGNATVVGHGQELACPEINLTGMSVAEKRALLQTLEAFKVQGQAAAARMAHAPAPAPAAEPAPVPAPPSPSRPKRGPPPKAPEDKSAARAVAHYQAHGVVDTLKTYPRLSEASLRTYLLRAGVIKPREKLR